jgi:hypothetical protein
LGVNHLGEPTGEAAMMIDLTDFLDIKPREGLNKKPGYMRNLDKLRELYEETENPVFAWSAYREVRKLTKKNIDITIPEWVLAYLDESANRLWALKSGKDIATDIAKAFDMIRSGGQGNIFTQYDRAFGRFLLKELIKIAKANDPKRKMTDIFEDIGAKQIKLIKAISPKNVDEKEVTAEYVLKRWYYDRKSK